MSKNTRRRLRRQGHRPPSSAIKNLRLQSKNRRDLQRFTSTLTNHVVVNAIDPWSDLVDSVLTISLKNPYHTKRASYAKKYTVVLSKDVNIKQFSQCIQNAILERFYDRERETEK